MEVAKEGETADLAKVEDDISEFLQRFPEDERTAEIRRLHDELDLYRLQRRYELRARLRGGSDSLGPLERAYIEATQLAATNPRAAAAKLEALMAVFSGGQPTEADRRCLKLAPRTTRPAAGQRDDRAGRLERDPAPPGRGRSDRRARSGPGQRFAAA